MRASRTDERVRYLSYGNPVLPTGGSNLISEAAAALPEHARAKFFRDCDDLLRPILTPELTDVAHAVATALAAARKRGAIE
jgi:hypothetical protein